MAVKENKDSKRMEEMVNAIKTISTMSLQDMVEVTSYLALENKKLREEFFRLKEDKAENEAMYEKAIKKYVETINNYVEIINNLQGGK